MGVTRNTPRLFLEISTWVLRAASLIAVPVGLIMSFGLMARTDVLGEHSSSGLGVGMLFGTVVVAVALYAFAETIDLLLDMKAKLDRS
jgi:ABC-type spermidine/putrescine transport system permease subunit II